MSGRRENALAGETSPYLLQHRHNPVDWSPWGPAALERARREDKPIFLSIGYAACHWCHVMERESFEDESIAALLNERFVPIKVDREERPDVDEIYMTAVQLMTGQGGWPLNVFLTPSLEPFYGGTYWPPVDRHGRPGLPTVLRHLDAAWREKRGEVVASAATIVAHVRDAAAPSLPAGDRPVGADERKRAVAQLAGRFDAGRGGFGAAPKFPPHGAIALLLREWRRSGEKTPLRMAEETLDAMARGGIYDQFGGGFARYSVDDRWLVPHFEKMLYDQALLVPVYVDAWLAAGSPRFRRVALETLDFVRREMTHPDGGLYSSIDADSEGEEGRFYLWTPEEVAAVLGEEEAREVCRAFDVTRGGNFEGRSIPHLAPGSPERAWPKDRLREARDLRPRPATDDKILTAWNGLMITAFARAAQAFGRAEDLASARRAAAFALTRLTDPGGGLRVSWRAGVAKQDAFLDDHAFLARGLLDLYEAGFDRAHLDAAADLARRAARRFGREGGGFWFASEDHEALPARATSSHDGALPSGAGVAAETFLRLASHLDDEELRAAGVAALTALRPLVERAPSAFASLLVAADFHEGPVDELVIAGPLDDPRTRALLAAARSRYLPNRIWAWAAPGDPRPLLAGRADPDRPSLHVCREHACRAPVHDPAEVEGALGAAP